MPGQTEVLLYAIQDNKGASPYPYLILIGFSGKISCMFIP